uniref:Uncharacterized protein n=1 Tax=Entomoneis paludosa TaxID=265537 RepID=A0A7S2YLA7_9STRA|mmetsp:Transcript_37478/g.77746  ORF Transcript_37478/g.77746 Transcript_37478/m.77746 type:complete len:108 (+) Transcript_37478:139-462(+)
MKMNLPQNETTSATRGGGTRVAGGRHIVPSGVTVERFVDGQAKELQQTCPPAVEQLLSLRGLTKDYQSLMQTMMQKGQVEEPKATKGETKKKGMVRSEIGSDCPRNT